MSAEQVDVRAAIASAVVSMQLNPDMPTLTCRITAHGALSKLEFDTAGAPVLTCAQCRSSTPVSEDHVRLALGATALPPSPVSAEFGTNPAAVDIVDLRRGRLRIDTVAGSIHAGTVAAVLIAAVAAFKLATLIGAGWALLMGVVIAVAVDLLGTWFARRRNRGRAAWLPGRDIRVVNLDPGTWIETPLNLNFAAASSSHAPTRATRVRSNTGLAQSPQTGYVELALADGHVYTVSGDAPVCTLHVEATRPGVRR